MLILVKAEPTPAQIAAGNYRKRVVRWRGLDIAIENEVGSVRRGRKPDGSEWATTMRNAYGYAKRSTGVDGDEVDVFLGPDLDSPDVFVVHQRKVGDWKAYDEDKCMVGFKSKADAVDAFLANYDDERFLGPVTTLAADDFVAKVRATADKPAMIKALGGGLVLFLKAHVRGYTRRDGVAVAPHDDRRAAAQADLFPASLPRAAAPAPQASPATAASLKPGEFSAIFDRHRQVDYPGAGHLHDEIAREEALAEWQPEMVRAPRLKDILARHYGDLKGVNPDIRGYFARERAVPEWMAGRDAVEQEEVTGQRMPAPAPAPAPAPSPPADDTVIDSDEMEAYAAEHDLDLGDDASMHLVRWGVLGMRAAAAKAAGDVAAHKRLARAATFAGHAADIATARRAAPQIGGAIAVPRQKPVVAVF